MSKLTFRELRFGWFKLNRKFGISSLSYTSSSLQHNDYQLVFSASPTCRPASPKRLLSDPNSSKRIFSSRSPKLPILNYNHSPPQNPFDKINILGPSTCFFRYPYLARFPRIPFIRIHICKSYLTLTSNITHGTLGPNIPFILPIILSPNYSWSAMRYTCSSRFYR